MDENPSRVFWVLLVVAFSAISGMYLGHFNAWKQAGKVRESLENGREAGESRWSYFCRVLSMFRVSPTQHVSEIKKQFSYNDIFYSQRLTYSYYPMRALDKLGQVIAQDYASLKTNNMDSPEFNPNDVDVVESFASSCINHLNSATESDLQPAFHRATWDMMLKARESAYNLCKTNLLGPKLYISLEIVRGVLHCYGEFADLNVKSFKSDLPAKQVLALKSASTSNLVMEFRSKLPDTTSADGAFFDNYVRTLKYHVQEVEKDLGEQEGSFDVLKRVYVLSTVLNQFATEVFKAEHRNLDKMFNIHGILRDITQTIETGVSLADQVGGIKNTTVIAVVQCEV